MFEIVVLLFGLWGGFGAFAVPMEGGTTITSNPVLYSHLVAIRSIGGGGANGTGEFKCLGVILSSMLVYTSNYCELTQANSKEYTIDASFSNSDPTASSAKVMNVDDGKHMNDFKQVALQMPGLMIDLRIPGPNDSFISTTPDTSKGIRASPFYNGDDADFTNMTWVALAYDGTDFKAGAVVIMTNKTECEELYKMAVHQNPHMPVNITEHLLCARKANHSMKYTLFGTSMDVEPGMPCDDSLGSPAMGHDMTMGIVVKAFCDPATLQVAFIQPILRPDTGLKPDVPSTVRETKSTAEIIYTGTVIEVTGLSPRKQRTFSTPSFTLIPTGFANKVSSHLMVWSIAVVLEVISAVGKVEYLT